MLQLGCATACSGVMQRISSALLVRNGPPEAVRMILSIWSFCSKSNTWKIAECSLSTGIRVAPKSATAFITREPAQTSVSLLARPMVAPRLIAARVGCNPAAPTIDAITQSAGRAAASTTASWPAAASIPVPDRASLRS